VTSQSVPLAGQPTSKKLKAGAGSGPVAAARGVPAAGTRARSLRLALIALVAVLIGFRWLNLILALETTSTGRQIQSRTADLSSIERENASLEAQIAEALAPNRMAAEAVRLGFMARSPIYLRVEAAAGESGSGLAAGGGGAPGPSALSGEGP
jgi:hypothetical protein